jgi:hypothetical protein
MMAVSASPPRHAEVEKSEFMRTSPGGRFETIHVAHLIAHYHVWRF